MRRTLLLAAVVLGGVCGGAQGFDDYDDGGGWGGGGGRWGRQWGNNQSNRGRALPYQFDPGHQNTNQNWNNNQWDYDPGYQNHNHQWNWNNNNNSNWQYQHQHYTQPQYNYTQPRYNYSQSQYSRAQTVVPQVTYSQEPIRISMPSGEAGLCAYVLSDGGQNWNYSISPGTKQDFKEDRSWKITYDRGNGFGEQTYGLKPGHYRFRQSSRGWELYRSSSMDTASTSNAPPPPM
ncbi:MAG: hypothetical protein KDA75_01015 [Planctomycetaceae bacterium]|nr:hypothetical protein [Planctomycetaceae bacterium]